jgi:hypothetical protein
MRATYEDYGSLDYTQLGKDGLLVISTSGVGEKKEKARATNLFDCEPRSNKVISFG